MLIIHGNITIAQFEDTALYPNETLYPEDILYPMDRTVGNYLYIRDKVTVVPSLIITENVIWKH